MSLRSHRQAGEKETKLSSTRDGIVARAPLAADDETFASPGIILQCDKGIGTIVISRTDLQNSLDVSAARALRNAVHQCANDMAVRVIVLRGADQVFCTGEDLSSIRAGGVAVEKNFPRQKHVKIWPGYGAFFRPILVYLHQTIVAMRNAQKPVIAAVNGTVAGGGLGIALACDFIVASARSLFDYSYCQTGLPGAAGVTFFLPKLIGIRRALGLAFCPRRLTATEAYSLGLVSNVFADDEFDDHIEALVRTLATGPTETYAATKRLMNSAIGMDQLAEHLMREIEELTRAADSEHFADELKAACPRFATQGAKLS
ncbi:MAG: enoyl-CoA hydratase/isomerase family protein [Candidatus Binatia bacterium]